MTKLTAGRCELCDSAGGLVLWRDEFCRVVLVDDPDYPGLCRVILESHVREMTDLDRAGCDRLMNAVFATEKALREMLHPEKVNLASFGNVVAHLHWHVIARFSDDRHFPNPIWAKPVREAAAQRAAPDADALAARVAANLA